VESRFAGLQSSGFTDNQQTPGLPPGFHLRQIGLPLADRSARWCCDKTTKLRSDVSSGLLAGFAMLFSGRF
jgi:hypothetical protein